MSQGKKLPDKIWKQFLVLLAEHTTSIASTCRALDITPHSYYNHRHQDREFGKKVDKIFDTIRRPMAEDVLASLISEKNLGAVKFYLSQRGGNRWNQNRIIPLHTQYSINHPPASSKIRQSLPTPEAMVAAEAYLAIRDMYADLDNFPKSITLDLKSISEKLKDKTYQKRMVEENKDRYKMRNGKIIDLDEEEEDERDSSEY